MAEKESQPKTDWSGAVREIVAYLNDKVGSSYRPAASSTKYHIVARLNQGFTIQDFKDVIDEKCHQWLGDERFGRYLRPQTLFGSKFDAYLEEARRYKKPSGQRSPSGGSGFRKGLLDD